MINNVITYKDLKCPSKELDCILKDVISKYQIELQQGKEITSVVYQNNVLTITLSDNSVFNTTVTLDETLTSLSNFTLSPSNILSLSYLNENNQLQTLNVDLNGLVTVDVNLNNASYNAATNVITLTETDNQVHTINLSEFSLIVNTLPDGSIQVVQEGVTKFIIPPTQDITSLNSINIVGDNIVISYTNNEGNTVERTLSLNDICNYCSTCIEISPIPTYTNAAKPLSSSTVQIIYVSDILASDGSTGSLMFWQPSTNSWKKIMIT